MKTLLTTILFSIAFFGCLANDGAYYLSGNHLIPMYESDIQVRKEILTIKRLKDDRAAITVYYEFFNPKQSKELEVGFEAYSPAGDNDKTPNKDGSHPYIYSFTVNLNGANLPYKVAIVSDSAYFINGKYKSKTVAQALKESANTDEPDFFYVYHFRAPFKEGLNILQHTYTIELGSSVEANYDLQYILTAALRWGNRQIDDFTLQIDMGSFQDVSIPATFFSNVSEWQITGEGKGIQVKKSMEGAEETGVAEFFMRNGMMVFQKKNFKPKGELFLASYYYYANHTGANITDKPFDSRHDPLPFKIEELKDVRQPANELSKRIMKNLPFARRGYVFKSAELQSYFEKQQWYLRNESYKAELSSLTAEERAWVNKW